MLALSGPITHIVGYPESGSPSIVRTFEENGAITSEHDALLIRSKNDLEKCRSLDTDSVVFVGDATPEIIDALKGVSKSIVLDSRFDYLRDGDIMGLRPSAKRIRSLYRRQSRHNSFLVTERCNHYCLMCSQPPRNVDDSWLLQEIDAAIGLVDKSTVEIGFTGGEPLLNWTGFIALLDKTKRELPDTEIHVLSNGRAFASTEVVKAWANVDHQRLMVGIPLYASVDTVHDYVVQAKNAFEETLLGILKLKNAGQRVEVRVVLHAITAPRIIETCTWLARNLPFVDHVALMGLENTGFAIANDKELWIDPVDYSHDLARGVQILDAAGVRVSIYNVPLCVLPTDVWQFAVKSISDWKNAYLPECEKCTEHDRCGGFFTTGRPKYSRAIKAFK